MLESIYRSQITQSPSARAGRITLSTFCAREARNRSSSARGVTCLLRTRDRTVSARASPPGSRVRRTRIARCSRKLVRSDICVVLPAPSTPSNVINRPGNKSGSDWQYSYSPLRLYTNAFRGELVPLHKLMLQAARVGVGRGEI